MPDIIIKDVDEDTIDLVRELATKHMVSFDKELRDIFIKGLNTVRSTDKLIEEFRQLRNSIPSMPEGFDVDAAIEEGRE
jgi:plasmid stability protein